MRMEHVRENHDGHRERLRKRLETENLPDHELLETLLFPFFPRGNVNDLAHKLLCSFGTLLGVLSATQEELVAASNTSERVCKGLRSFGRVFAQSYGKRVQQKVLSFSTLPFIERQQAKYEGLSYEVVDLYLLDSAGNIREEYRITQKAESEVKIRLRDIAILLEEKKPAGLVLVHNHPTEEAEPSDWDDEATGVCLRVCDSYGVDFRDHLIFSKRGTYSYFLAGRMGEDMRNRLKSNGQLSKNER